MIATERFLRDELSRHLGVIQNAHAALLACDFNDRAARDCALGLWEQAARSGAEMASRAAGRPVVPPKEGA